MVAINLLATKLVATNLVATNLVAVLPKILPVVFAIGGGRGGGGEYLITFSGFRAIQEDHKRQRAR